MDNMDGCLFPDLEFGVPMDDAFPQLKPNEELAMRARTIQFIANITNTEFVPDENTINEANKLAHEMVTDPAKRIEYAAFPNETIAYLAGMVAQMNHAILDDLSQLRLYIVNQLIHTVENPESQKTKLMALKLLGEIGDVGAFVHRSEVTVNVKPIEEVEKELRTVIDALPEYIPPALPAPAMTHDQPS
jgi:tetrahydromethanopterin S-methyltransferase subunit B